MREQEYTMSTSNGCFLRKKNTVEELLQVSNVLSKWNVKQFMKVEDWHNMAMPEPWFLILKHDHP